MLNLWNMLFGCSHRRYTFPRSAKQGQRRPEAARLTGTYVVCLKCGKEFPYDWNQMKVIDWDSQETVVSAPTNVVKPVGLE